MFYVRTIHPEAKRVEVAGFDLEPGLEQGQSVCKLFGSFLADHPAEFREKLPFLKNSDIELQWAAASGGAAFAAFFGDGQAITIGVLLTGVNEESDALMLEALRESVAVPMLGAEAEALLESPERPLMLQLQMPDQPDKIPAVQLLSTALASVYFRTILALDAERSAAVSGSKAVN
ncbi:MAG: hypothetical protein ABI972_10230 [Acidobacteriota bacterium]